MRRLLPLLVPALLLAAPAAGGAAAAAPPPPSRDGYVLVDGTAASVEGEVLFRSDVEREACLIRCGAFPDEEGRDVTFAGARNRLVQETAILQEQRRLALGAVDNGVLLDAASQVRERLAACPDPCAATVGEKAVIEFAWRRVLVRDFLERRVSAFVAVTDEEVERERALAASRRGVPPEELDPDEVREALVAAKREEEIARWRESAAAKARVVLPGGGEEGP